MKDQIKMIIFVFILGVVTSGILLGSEAYTRPIIDEYQEFAFKRTILKSFEIPYKDETVLDIFADEITMDEEGDVTIYYSKEGNVGFEFEGKGLWGPITGFMTLESDFVTVKGIQITYNEETPGLGGIVAEQWYLDKYKGKKFDPDIIVKKDADINSTNEVDAITGATGTSNAFQLILNDTYQDRREDLE